MRRVSCVGGQICSRLNKPHGTEVCLSAPCITSTSTKISRKISAPQLEYDNESIIVADVLITANKSSLMKLVNSTTTTTEDDEILVDLFVKASDALFGKLQAKSKRKNNQSNQENSAFLNDKRNATNDSVLVDFESKAYDDFVDYFLENKGSENVTSETNSSKSNRIDDADVDESFLDLKNNTEIKSSLNSSNTILVASKSFSYAVNSTLSIPKTKSITIASSIRTNKLDITRSRENAIITKKASKKQSSSPAKYVTKPKVNTKKPSKLTTIKSPKTKANSKQTAKSKIKKSLNNSNEFENETVSQGFYKDEKNYLNELNETLNTIINFTESKQMILNFENFENSTNELSAENNETLSIISALFNSTNSNISFSNEDDHLKTTDKFEESVQNSTSSTFVTLTIMSEQEATTTSYIFPESNEILASSRPQTDNYTTTAKAEALNEALIINTDEVNVFMNESYNNLLNETILSFKTITTTDIENTTININTSLSSVIQVYIPHENASTLYEHPDNQSLISFALNSSTEDYSINYPNETQHETSIIYLNEPSTTAYAYFISLSNQTEVNETISINQTSTLASTTVATTLTTYKTESKLPPFQWQTGSFGPVKYNISNFYFFISFVAILKNS
jgi:hypothetical protein